MKICLPSACSQHRAACARRRPGAPPRTLSLACRPAPRRALPLIALLALAAGASHDPHANLVLAVAPGPGTAGAPDNTLGSPSGEGLYNGSTDTYTLGVDGSITLRLGTPCLDLAGTDLIVSENPFYILGTSDAFIEVLFVEVSSNGADFARFPTAYTGPAGPFPPFSGSPPHHYRGFAGAMPVAANPATGVDPLDVVDAGGDAFDLRDLSDHPLVLAGLVDLDAITQVRLVDIDAGSWTDSLGTLIYDHGISSVSSAEVDAITAANHHGNVVNGRPEVELELDAAGFLTIRVEDMQGLSDVLPGMKASVDGLPINFFDLLSFFLITEVEATSFTLSTGPIPPGVFGAVLKVGTVDGTGLRSGDAVVVQ